MTGFSREMQDALRADAEKLSAMTGEEHTVEFFSTAADLEGTCEACNGSGVTVFAIRVYEHGCGFAHDSTDERPCEECLGTGKVTPLRKCFDPPPNITDDDLPF